MAKYHINPYTSSPGVCYAKPGNCPYGGDNEHYDSLGEAQAVAYAQMEEQYPLSFDSGEDFYLDEEGFENIDDYELEQVNTLLEETETLEEEYGYLNNLEEDEVLEEVFSTKDKALLDGILSRKFELDNVDSDRLIATAARNYYVPQEWVDDGIENHSSYSDNFLVAISHHRSLSETDLFKVAQETKSPQVRDAFLTSPNISEETILANIGQDGNEGGMLAMHLHKNPNCPEPAKTNARKRLRELRLKKMMKN